MTDDAITESLAGEFMRRTDDRAGRVVVLAALLSPAAVIEPELIRAVRLHVEPQFDTSVEVDLWFSPLVQDRSPSGITLRWEVVPALIDRLSSRVRAADEGDLVLDVGRIIERVHLQAPPLRVVQEKVIWASIVGDMASVEDELTAVVRAQRDPKRHTGVSGWVDRVLRRMPEPVRATEVAWQLGIEASLTTGRDPGLDIDVPITLFDGAVADVVQRRPSTVLPLLRRNGVVELGAVETDLAFAIELPATQPLAVRLEWADAAAAVTVRSDELVTLPDHDGPLLIRTLAGFVHEVEEGAAPAPPASVFTLDMLPAQNGTSVWIEYGVTGATQRILVDGGSRRTVDILEDRLERLDPDDREFELIILSHMDEPSSGGLIRLFEHAAKTKRNGNPPLFTSRDIWTNAPALIDDPPTDRMSRSIELVEMLDQLDLPVNRAMDRGPVARSPSLASVDLADGMSITVLGPHKKTLDHLRSEFRKGAPPLGEEL